MLEFLQKFVIEKQIALRAFAEGPLGTPSPNTAPNPNPNPNTAAPNPNTAPGSGISFQLENPLQSDSLAEFFDKLYSFALTIAVPILTIVIIWGAFKILTGGSKPDNITEGRKIIFWGIIGFVIILVAKSISVLIKSILGG